MITEQRNVLADCLFCWSCQSPFGKKEIVAVMDFLKECVPSTADGAYDHVTLKAVMTVLMSWCQMGYEVLVDELVKIEGMAQFMPNLMAKFASVQHRGYKFYYRFV